MAANHIPVIDISKPDQECGDRLLDAVHKWGFAFIKGSNTGFSAPIVEMIFALIDLAQGGQEWFAERHSPSKGPSGSILRLLRVCNQDTLGLISRLIKRSTQSSRPVQPIPTQRRMYVPARTVIMPGLELLSPNGQWSPVPVRPPGTEGDPYPPILVNVGDLLSYWTNGFLKSTVHRVVFPPDKGTVDRYSIAYFCHPADATRLTPVPSELIASDSASKELRMEEPTDSSPITAKEHLRNRLAATYGWDKQSDHPAG
ncbi:MAG: hypothetical protein Q9219_003641 [cf. Caloplaca sp. 3 TL-2023]